MPELFIFLLKVNAALIVFCLAYYLVLRRLTFYTLNRFFLIAGIVFSSVYPFVDPAVLFGNHEELIKPLAAALPQAYVMAEQVATVDYWLIMKVVFWLGVVLMAIRLGIRFYSLYLIHRKSVPDMVSVYPVRLLTGDVSTFSFWKNIYLNPGHHASEELSAILEHEHVHVQQLHTADILLAELSTVFYWFNPGVWYMRKAIKENVEFVTDQNVLQKGVDRRAYQYSMLSPQLSAQPSVLMNNFNVTGIKRRIQMMNKKRSSGMQLVRYVFLLPVLLLVTTAFTLFRKEVKESKVFIHTISAAKSVLSLARSSDQHGIEISVSGKAALSKAKRPVKKKSVKKTVVSPPALIKTTRSDSAVKMQPSLALAPVMLPHVKLHAVVVIRRDSNTVGPNTFKFTYTDDGKITENGAKDNTQTLKEVVIKNIKVIGYGKINPDLAPFINDKRSSPGDLAKLNANDITSVNVKPDPDNKEIKTVYIYSNKANN